MVPSKSQPTQRYPVYIEYIEYCVPQMYSRVRLELGYTEQSIE